MELALLFNQLFMLLLGLHLRHEVFGHEETVALRYVCRARDALLLELAFGGEVHEFRFHARACGPAGWELEAIDMPLFGELLLQALAAPPELGHGVACASGVSRELRRRTPRTGCHPV